MAKIKVNFVWKNDTSGTQRYQEVNDAGEPKKSDQDGQIIGALYLRKEALKTLGVGTPKQFSITIDDIK